MLSLVRARDGVINKSKIKERWKNFTKFLFNRLYFPRYDHLRTPTDCWSDFGGNPKGIKPFQRMELILTQAHLYTVSFGVLFSNGWVRQTCEGKPRKMTRLITELGFFPAPGRKFHLDLNLQGMLLFGKPDEERENCPFRRQCRKRALLPFYPIKSCWSVTEKAPLLSALA